MNQTMNMPGAILMVLRDQKNLKFSFILLTLIPDKLHKPRSIGIKIITIKLIRIKSTRKKIIPGITECILQHHRSSTGKITIQFCIVMLLILTITHIHNIRIPIAFEGNNLVNIISISMYRVRW